MPKIKSFLLFGFLLPGMCWAQDWIQQGDGLPRQFAAMAYDPVHHQTVVFGGEDTPTSVSATTSVFNGTSWTQLTPATSPSARMGAVMAWDAAHSQIILFGGCATFNCSSYLNDTWAWNGTTWTLKVAGSGPSPRQGATMAYSATTTNSGLILFGGGGTGGPQNDTWKWDGTSWTGLSLNASPSARQYATMSYDPVGKHLVLFGGALGSGFFQDTWEFDGVTWTQVTTAHSPSVRSGQGQVYDPVRNLTVMAAGTNLGGSTLNDTWTFNGTDWTQETTTTNPTGGGFTGAAYDTQHSTMVLFGGETSTGPTAHTWTLGFTYAPGWIQYSQYSRFGMPTARAFTASASDDNNVYFYGGQDSTNNLLNELWEWTGYQYIDVLTNTNAGARVNGAMVNIPGTGLLMFGGGNGTGGATPLSDTWLFQGDWFSQTAGPPARYGHAMVYDSIKLHAAVMFGGSGSQFYQDTWKWTGGTWTQLSPATSPPARQFHSMVYDAGRAQTVMFGGSTSGSPALQNDTWVFDGTNWTQMSPANSPPARSRAQMIYDSVHGVVLLFGGQGSTNILNDLWQWDGVNWTELDNSPSFTSGVYTPGRVGAVFAFLKSAQQAFLFSGNEIQNGISGTDAFLLTSPYTAGTLPTGYYQQPYSAQMQPLGGACCSYTFGEVGPPDFTFEQFNFSLGSNGAVTAAADSFIPYPTQDPTIFGLTLSDSQGQKPLIPIALVTDNVITFAPTPPADATVGGTYSYQLAASGGTPPFLYTLNTNLSWLSINPSHQLIANCSAAVAPATGTYFLTVFDSIAGFVQVGPLTINCNPAPQITNPSALPGGSTNSFYFQQLTTNAVYDAPGAAPYSWTIMSGALPASLNFDTTNGIISGVLTAAGHASFQIKFTDARGATATKTFTIDVIPEFVFTTTSLPTGNIGVPYPAGAAAQVTGGVPPYTYSVAGLPPGLQFNTSTGAITGTPTTAGTYSPVFTVDDSINEEVINAVGLNVVAAGTLTEDWVQVSPATVPLSRQYAGMFYDSVRNKSILFGGASYAIRGDTLSWDGSNWTTLSPATSPSARSNVMTAFDPVHQQGVMFGGVDASNTQLNETWLWNGTTWTQASPSTAPPVRLNGMMAWDGHHVVLFGGTNTDQDINDTWIWDGTNWTQLAPSTSPSPRHNGMMAYDAAHGKGVLFGGVQGFTDYSETWLWDGVAQTWTLQSPSTSPSPRDSSAIDFDSHRNQVVLFGGFNSDADGFYQDTWSWDGTTWTNVNPPHQPAPLYGATMVYDAPHGGFVLFGGGNTFDENFFQDNTWILDAPFVPGGTIPGAAVGSPYTFTPAVSASFSPLTFVQTGAPAWMSINSATGALSGTPNATGPSTITYTVVDPQGIGYSASLSLTTTATLDLQPHTLPNATAGTNYSVQLSATGGIPPYTFSATGMPAGLSINASNQIVGQCTASSSNLMLKVNDTTLSSTTIGPYSVTCNPAPSITTTSPLPHGLINTAYSTNITATGGTAPLTYTVSTGSLPANFQLTGNQIAGTTTAAGTASFSIKATDFWGATSTVAYTLNIESALTIVTTSLPSVVQGASYPSGVTLNVSGGTGAGTYTFSATGLPPGLSIDPATGVISGIATQSGIYQPIFTVTDQNPLTTHATIAMQVLAITGNPNWANFLLSSPSPRDSYAVTYDTVHSQTVLYGGTGLNETWTYTFPATWTKKTPSASPTAQFGAGMSWVASQNNAVLFGGQVATGTVGETWTWDGTNWTKQTPSVSPSARSYAAMGPDSTHHQVVLFGGSTDGTAANATNDTYTWDGTNWTKQTPSTIPPARLGAAIADGPTGPILFGGSNASGTSLGQTYLWNGTNWFAVNPPIQPPARAYASMVFDVLTGTTILFGGSDQGISMNDTWQWDGSQWTQLNPASKPAARSHIALAYDGSSAQVVLFGGRDTTPLNDTWILGGPSFTVSTIPAASAGAPYTGILTVVGGTPPYQYVQTGNPQTLPAGLNLDPVTGLISGATQAVGTYTIGIAVSDSQSASTAATRNFNLIVTPAGTLVLAPSTLPNATASTAYNVQLSAGGGITPYIFSATGLPAGLSINANNQVAGVCTAGSTNVVLTVTDNSLPTHLTASVGPLTVQCNALPAPSTASPLPSGVVNAPYTATLQATGGTAPIAWTLGSNNLPTGFQLSSAGVLTGTPTIPNNITFTAAITDFWGATNSKVYNLAIYPVLSITTTGLPNGTAGTAYQSGVTIVPAGGTGAGTYGFTATGLPPGYVIDPATGVISGTTSQSGQFTPTFNVTDSDAQTASKQIGLTVLSGGAITILSPSVLPTGATGQAYSYQLKWSGGVGTTTVSAKPLPSWLQLNPTTGVLSGTPTVGGVYTIPIRVTDSQTPTPNIANQTETIVVNPPVITSPSPLPAATIGVAYTQVLTAGSAQAPYTWVSTNLPQWLTLATDGTLTGTPPVNTPATVTFNVTVTDSLGAYTTGSLTLPVGATPGLFFQTTSPLTAATPNTLYSTTIQVGGGNGVYTLSATGLPNWLSFNSKTNILSGTPPSAGPVTFQLTVSDNVNQTLTQYFTLPVNATLSFGTASLPPASVGLPYPQTLDASGGSGTYTWTAAGLPSWLTLSPSGVFSGTPPQPTPVTTRITLTDSQKNSISENFTILVHSALTIDTTSPLAPATVNFPYQMTFASSGGSGNYQWTATGLPAGFTLSTAGVLFGTPTTASTLTFAVQVADSASHTASLNVSLPVSSATPTVNSAALPQAVVGVPYHANLTASGGSPGYTFTASGLPTWLNITQAGYLSGTPTTSGNVNFQATVTDSKAATSASPAAVQVNPSLTITTTSLPTATASVAYSTTLAATGGVTPYTWSSTNLPTGLAISSAGVLSGTLAQTGNYSFGVTLWDSQTSVATQNYTLLVATGVPLSFVTQSLNTCVPGVACSTQIVATGGAPPYKFSVPANANLGGLTLSTTGLLSGTPTSGGTYQIPVTVTDLQGSLSKTYTLTVIQNLQINTSSLPNGTVGTNYGTALSASGGQPPYSWSLAPGSGPLPGGLSLDSQGGNIYGSPNAAGTFNFSVQVSDGQQTSPARSFSIVIAPLITGPLTISSPSQLAAGLAGTAYSQTLSANGGSGQYTWSNASGTMPAGLSLLSSGAITGTPSAAGTYNFSLTVSDTANNSATGAFTLIIASPNSVSLTTPNPLPNGAVGVTYLYSLAVLGGTPPYSYSITSGQVPTGVTFDPTNGTFSGIPTAPGSFGIVLNVQDSGSSAGTSGGSVPGSPAANLAPRANVTSSYTIQIVAPGGFQITTPQNLPPATMGVAYTTTFAASGGAAPYKWQLVTGTLPAGLSLSRAGVLAGIATQAGQASVVVKATDSTGATATGAFLVQTINPNVPFINPLPPLSSATAGQSYQGGFTAVGGKTPYTWSISTGSLPQGIQLDPAAGTLSGTPAQSGSYPFTVKVVDSKQVSATQAFTLRVNSLTLQITPAQIPSGLPNTPYSVSFSVSGGTAPYSWSLSAGGFLSGFSIDPATGVLTGTPTAAGNFPFTISVTDSNFGLAQQTYNFAVVNPALSITTTSLPSTTAGASYSTALVASNGTSPYTWTITTGSLPQGIQLQQSTGLLSGTASTPGSYPFTVQVQDGAGKTAQASFTLVVNALPLSIVTTSLPSGAVATAYSQTVQSSGGTGALTWSISSGALPTGLSIGPSTGIISGTPSATGSFSFTVQAIDTKSVSARQSYTVSIAGPPTVPAITITGLPATSKPGDQPTLTISLANPYPLPITVTATLSISPNPGNSTDLMFANGTRTTQVTIPANATSATLPFQTGTLAGTITVSLSFSAAGVDITPPTPPTATTAIASAVPTISSVAATTTSGGLQITIIGTSTTRDMKTAAFHFTAAGGAALQTTDLTVDVSAMFTAWYGSAASLATGSQFSLTMPFTISGNVSSIASVTVTLTNSAGPSAAATANVP